jgi:hypothetical protein
LLIFCWPRKDILIMVVALVIVVGICHALMAWTTDRALPGGISGIAGLAFVGAMIELGTGLLSSPPDAFRGRIDSVQQFCFRAEQPLCGLMRLGGAVHRHPNSIYRFRSGAGVWHAARHVQHASLRSWRRLHTVAVLKTLCKSGFELGRAEALQREYGDHSETALEALRISGVFVSCQRLSPRMQV